MTDPRTPRTEAGRAMRKMWSLDGGEERRLTAAILAIEAEASTLGSIKPVRDRPPMSLPDSAYEAPLGSSERLAAALHKAEVDCWPSVDDCHEANAHIGAARRILAADPALSDPDAERQRAIGEAVERLPAWSRIDRTDVRWRVLLYRGDAEMRKGYGTAMDMVARDALPEAIDAVLPAAQEPERG
jgi:hypothetical protein